MNRAILTTFLILLGAAPARADMLMLNDGRFIEGVEIERTEEGYKLLYKNGEVFVPASLVKDCLIEGAAGYEPRNDQEREMIKKGLVPFEGEWIRQEKRDSIVAKRKEEQKKRLEEAKAHRLWRNRYMTSSKNFEFEYTIPPEVFESYRDLMETYYSVFTKAWRIQRPSKLGKLKVCFYHDYDSFLQVGGAGYGTLAYYRFVEPLELNFFYDRLQPEETIAVMFHEANHYLTHLIDLDFHYPHNINEAMAEYYGASRWDPVKKEMSTGHLQEGRLTEVVTDIQGGEWQSLEKYLKNELGYHDYTWGWSFVHFMMETPTYAKRFKTFFLALARGRDVERVPFQGTAKTVEGKEIARAFQKYMGVSDLSALEKEWHDYIKKNLQLQTERGYAEAGQRAMRTGQSIKAKRYFQMAIDKGSTSAMVYKSYADLLLQDGKTKEAIELAKKAIELDPLNANLYAFLGRAYRRSGKKNEQEAQRLLALAQEIDPDNIDIELLLEEELEKAGEVGPEDGSTRQASGSRLEASGSRHQAPGTRLLAPGVR